MPVAFQEVPPSVRYGVYGEFDSSFARVGLPLQPWKALVVAQKTAAGTAGDNTIHRVSRIEDVIELGGVGSMAHRMMVRWFSANAFTPVDVLFVPNSSMIASIQTITVTVSSGSLATAGTVYLWIDGYRFAIAVTKAMDDDAVAAAIEAELDKYPEMPFTASVLANVVTVTAKNGGAHSPAMDIRLDYRDDERSHNQVSIAVATDTPGSGEPTYLCGTAADFDLIGDEPYNLFVVPYNSSAMGLKMDTEGERRWGPTTAADGMFVLAHRDTYVNHADTWDPTRDFNSQYILPVRYELDAVTPPNEVAASVGGRIAARAETDPARQFGGLTLPGCNGAPTGKKFKASERTDLLNNGNGTLRCAPDGSLVIELIMSSRTQTDLGAIEEAYRSGNRMFILSYQRYSTTNLFETKYAGYKLAQDGTQFGAGQLVMTPSLARAEMHKLFRLWEDIGLVEDFDQFKADLIVEIDAVNKDRLNIVLPTNHINNLLVTAFKIQFRI